MRCGGDKHPHTFNNYCDEQSSTTIQKGQQRKGFERSQEGKKSAKDVRLLIKSACTHQTSTRR